MKTLRILAALGLALLSCGEEEGRAIEVAPAQADLARALLADTEGFRVVETESPDGGAVALVAVDPCDGCYTVTVEGEHVRVEGDRAGLGYGLTEVLEGAGYRFAHPFDTRAPASLVWPPAIADGPRVPEIAQRGLHLHTLHPIEAMEPFLVASAEHQVRGQQILTWAARQRANYVQWVLVDDVQRGRVPADEWRTHQQGLVDHAHVLGLRAGVVLQLFGAANLQLAFDLVDEPELGEEAVEAEMRRRMQLLAGLGLDEVNLGFGEFSGEEPDVFVAELDRAIRVIRDELDDVPVTATVHVGDTPDTRVVYMGEDMIYYFLVQFASQPVIPLVHTVMWYALDDPAGGVYHHTNFDEHRQLLADRMAAGEPVVYFPETAYWIAWDVNVPLYAPIYPRARTHDLDLLAELPGQVDGHIVFSSGWEWGYWQNDRVALRSSYGRVERWTEHLEGIYRGPDEAALLDALFELGELQHEVFVDQELAPYVVGRDSLIEGGYGLGIVSQPDRIEPEDVAELDAEALAAYRTIAGQLDSLASRAEQIAARVDALDLEDDRWTREVRQAVDVFALRARFVAVIHGALAAGEASAATLETIDAILAEAQPLADARHGDLHDPEPTPILANRRSGPTFYDYGYLREAVNLCFWRRERVKLSNAIGIPERLIACVL